MIEWLITNLLTALWVWGAGFGVGNVIAGVKYKTCKKIAAPGWMYWAKGSEVAGQMAAWMGLAVFLAAMTGVVAARQVYVYDWLYPAVGLVAGVVAGAVMIKRELRLGAREWRGDWGLDDAGGVAGVGQETVKVGAGNFQGGGVGVGVKKE